MSTTIANSTSAQHKIFGNNPVKSGLRGNWRGRMRNPEGRGFTVIPNTLIDARRGLGDRDRCALVTLLSHAHNETGMVQVGRARMAEWMDKSPSTAKRALENLQLKGFLIPTRVFNRERGCWEENTYLVVANPGKSDPTPTVKNDPVVLIKHYDLTTTTPLPPKGGGEVHVAAVDHIEPQRPAPSAEVHQALTEARELRAQRKAERRTRRHSQARERKHSRPEPSPVQKAVRHVMVVLRVCPGLWATRNAIRTSVERWMAKAKVCAEAAANALIARWKDYALLSVDLEYPCGMMTWFGECRWGEVSPSTVRELRRRSEASVGVYRPPVVVDTAALGEKMKALLVGFDFEGEENEHSDLPPEHWAVHHDLPETPSFRGDLGCEVTDHLLTANPAPSRVQSHYARKEG